MAEIVCQMSEKYEEYLIDESKYKGYADSISFPESEEEIVTILEKMKDEQTPVTIQGAKTGITGAGIPMGGHILNLSHMNKVIEHSTADDGTGRIVVEPGINLMELQKEIAARFRKEHLFWPPIQRKLRHPSAELLPPERRESVICCMVIPGNMWKVSV